MRSRFNDVQRFERPTFHLGEADGVPLWEWTDDFVMARPIWVDIVEDFVPIP